MVFGEHLLPVSCCCPGDNQKLVLVTRDLADRECHRGRRHINDDVNCINREPFSSDGSTDIGLVLVIRRNDLNLNSLVRGLEISNCHLRRNHGALAGEVCGLTRAVVEHTKSHGDLSVRSGSEGRCREGAAIRR